MQYVGQTCRFLKTRFSEHYCGIKKPHKIDNFLYRHFKQTNHSTRSISIQPVENNTYDDNLIIHLKDTEIFLGMDKN